MCQTLDYSFSCDTWSKKECVLPWHNVLLIFIPNFYRSTCTFAIVCCCYSAENYPFPSAFCHFICLRLVCCVCFSPFFIFIFLLHLVLDFLIRGLYFLCRFGACNEMCGHFKWRNETKKEYESWLFVNKRKKKKPTRTRTQCKNGTSVLNFCVPYSSCHQFYSRQTRLFYFIIYSKFMYTERCTIFFCARKGANTNEHLINEQQYECWRCWWFN